MTVQHAIRVFEAVSLPTPAVALVALHVAYRADRKGVIRHSQTEIAATTGLSRASVATAFVALEQAGVIERAGHGRYVLCQDAFDDAEFPAVEPIQRQTPEQRKQQQAASAELERIKAARQPGQEIRFTHDGWPVLTGPNGTRLRTEDH